MEATHGRTLQRGEPLDAIRIHPGDTVAVALRALRAGEAIRVPEGDRIVLRDNIPAGHKIALTPLEPGAPVVKYGFSIGCATAPLRPGEWVHEHNLRTQLDSAREPQCAGTASPPRVPQPSLPAATWSGYRRRSGRVGTRNELWILNTVGCVNHVAQGIARTLADRYAGQVDGVHAFTHPYGCSQLGDDLANTQRVLAGLLRHPNAGGVVLLGLGCENNQLASLLAMAGEVDRKRLRVFNSQDVGDEVEHGTAAAAEIVAQMAGDRREEVPVSELILGHKCGGSDGFSGITANPLLGRIADMVTGAGGGVLLSEVPEMFGAESVLLNRAATEPTCQALSAMIHDFKEYFRRHGQPIYENPSPGNRDGGLTTLEEKSLGAVQKGGQAPVRDVLRYGELAAPGGLTVLEAPGNDGVSSTAMVASGATVLLFTTGRGTPLGFPVPTLKISSNSDLAERKPHWIDFDAGALIAGASSMDELSNELFALVLAVASGRTLTKSERAGYREIAIWKAGVTL